MEDATVPPQVGILFALPEEAAPLLRRLNKGAARMMSHGVHPAVFTLAQSGGRSVHIRIALSGAGRRPAAEIAADLLDDCTTRPLGLIVCGFGGGLSSQATPGSLVVADVVRDLNASTEDEDGHADSMLLAAAESVRLSNIPIQRGMLVTADRIVTQSESKRSLGAATGALAVDMETAGAVRVAQQRAVPWLAIRAITDGVNDDLPFDFNLLAGADGQVDRGRVIGAALTHPWKIPALIRLGARSSLAAKNLTAFLKAFLSKLPESKT